MQNPHHKYFIGEKVRLKTSQKSKGRFYFVALLHVRSRWDGALPYIMFPGEYELFANPISAVSSIEISDSSLTSTRTTRRVRETQMTALVTFDFSGV